MEPACYPQCHERVLRKASITLSSHILVHASVTSCDSFESVHPPHVEHTQTHGMSSLNTIRSNRVR